VSLVAPGRHRLLRGVAVAGAQVVLALSERLISEEGRVAIHSADLVATAADDGSARPDVGDDTGNGEHADGAAADRGQAPSNPIDLAPHDG
jgi:hypothetical protein